MSGLQQEVTVQLASFHTTSRQFQGFSDVSPTMVHSSFGMPSGFLPGWGLKTNSASACGLYGTSPHFCPTPCCLFHAGPSAGVGYLMAVMS